MLHIYVANEWPSIIQFVRWSACIIDEPKLTNTIGINESLRAPEFSSVTTLHSEKPYYVKEGLEDLTYNLSSSQNDVFPGLENLIITKLDGPYRGDGWSIPDLTNMLTSRLQPQRAQYATRSYLNSIRLEFTKLADEHATPLKNFVRSK